MSLKFRRAMFVCGLVAFVGVVAFKLYEAIDADGIQDWSGISASDQRLCILMIVAAAFATQK